MPDYLLALNLRGRLCVVVGAGRVGRRKVRGLRAAGARIRVIDPCAQALALVDAESLCRPYRPGDLAGALLVVAATDDPAINRSVAAEARRIGALAQAVDDPEGSDFHLPALLRRGELTVAVATAGGSPALAAAVRDEIARLFGEEWGTVLAIAAALRRKRLTETEPTPYNHDILHKLLAGGIAGLVAAGDQAAVERLLQEVIGEPVSLDQLGAPLSKGMK